jgi:hypothetical protein
VRCEAALAHWEVMRDVRPYHAELPAGLGALLRPPDPSDPEAGAMLRDAVDDRFDCTWLPMEPLSLVLGAHTGPSMVGVACAPEATMASAEPPA